MTFIRTDIFEMWAAIVVSSLYWFFYQL